jgi:hypothetical protein
LVISQVGERCGCSPTDFFFVLSLPLQQMDKDVVVALYTMNVREELKQECLDWLMKDALCIVKNEEGSLVSRTRFDVVVDGEIAVVDLVEMKAGSCLYDPLATALRTEAHGKCLMILDRFCENEVDQFMDMLCRTLDWEDCSHIPVLFYSPDTVHAKAKFIGNCYHNIEAFNDLVRFSRKDFWRDAVLLHLQRVRVMILIACQRKDGDFGALPKDVVLKILQMMYESSNIKSEWRKVWQTGGKKTKNCAIQ